MKGEALKGHLDLLLLATIHSAPAHGYAICEKLRQRTGGELDLPEGTVYPALHRLESAALLASAWSDDAGRRRRVYQLTRRGRAALGEQADQWQRFSAAVGVVVNGAAWPNPA